MPNSFGKTVGAAGSFPIFSAELAWLGDMRVSPISGSHTMGDLLTLFVNYVKQWTRVQSGSFGPRHFVHGNDHNIQNDPDVRFSGQPDGATRTPTVGVRHAAGSSHDGAESGGSLDSAADLEHHAGGSGDHYLYECSDGR